MCGIAGIFNLNGNAVTHQEMVKVTRAIAHRGPDGEGIFIDDNLGLKNSELSIPFKVAFNTLLIKKIINKL